VVGIGSSIVIEAVKAEVNSISMLHSTVLPLGKTSPKPISYTSIPLGHSIGSQGISEDWWMMLKGVVGFGLVVGQTSAGRRIFEIVARIKGMVGIGIFVTVKAIYTRQIN
jgi:hypothetical protein